MSDGHRENGRVPDRRERERIDEQVRKEFDPNNLPDTPILTIEDLKIDSRQLFLQATEQTRMAICIVDPHAPDEPIVYVNRAFVEISGYEREEIVGRNCRFLQGEDTDPAKVAEIRAALDERRVAVVELLNYRKDGTSFWNALHVGPIYDRDGKLVYFYGSQWDITELVEERDERRNSQRLARELQHRTDNLFAVISAIVRMSARRETDVGIVTDKITARIDALSKAHRASIAPGGEMGAATTLEHLAEEVLLPYRSVREDRIELGGEELELPRKVVTPIGVVLHELATNAIKYGALSSAHGKVSLHWSKRGEDIAIEWIERGGPRPEATRGSGSGSRIVAGVLGQIGGAIEQEFTDEGMHARVTVPARTLA